MADAPLIVIGTVTQLTVLPPLDPNTPDTLTHFPHFTASVDEYIKGSGPQTLTIRETGFWYTFDQNGNVFIQHTSVEFFAEDSVGKRYLMFLPGLDPSYSPACGWSRQLGLPSDEELIQRIRAMLQATPMPSPSPAPTVAATAAPTGSPASVPPLGLPRSGGASDGDSSLVGVATIAALSSLVLGAGLVWRWHNRRHV